VDTAVIDRNSDGVPDAVVADTNGDGSVDAAEVDIDYDGIADVTFPDQGWQPSTPEQELQPDTTFNHNDLLDTTISGTPDAGYIDVGDGESVTWGLG